MDTDKQITISRIFDAPVGSVWKAWTDPEIVREWWGPEGFYAPSVKIDLREGGKYIFGMHGPKGSEFDKDMYSAGVYKEIIPMNKLVVTDYFSDENGEMITPEQAGMEDPMFPQENTVTVLFESLEPNKTKLTIIYPEPQTVEQYEAMKKSGMVEGWNSSLNKLASQLG